MQSNEANIFARDDTLFGVCQALGEDFGFNPNFLRLGLAILLLWNPVATLSAYAAAGALVLVSRLLVRAPRTASVAAQPGAERQLVGDNEEEALAVAA